MFHNRPRRPPPHPFPNQTRRSESATNLFTRVAAVSNAQHANLCALGAPQLAPQPGSWRAYDPTPTPPLSPGVTLQRIGSLVSSAEIITPAPAPYPPPVPTPAPAERIAGLVPWASGSTSQIFKTIIKRPQLVQMYLNDQLHTNAPDVENQFLAELRAYQTVGPHRHIAALLGIIDGLGMVLELVEGDTLFERALRRGGAGNKWENVERVNATFKVEWFNQMVEALCHVHMHGLSHGDINSLNVLITLPTAHPPNIVKLIDFGRSTFYAPPGSSLPPSEVPHPPAHPFAAPEVLRGGKYIANYKRLPVDGRLADAYSLGVLLWCLDEERLIEIDQAAQRKEDVVLFAHEDDDVHAERGYGADDEESVGSSSGSGSGSGLITPDSSSSTSPETKKVPTLFDEGYFSGNNEGALKEAGQPQLLKSTAPTITPRVEPTSKRSRLFTGLIRGYMRRWEERTPISLSQRLPLPGAT
ncbi:hypothetical protein FRB94_003649 [Tulasnella sp. JGI-2019a]|nr:hypothetical protein FRB94_003649 [Tulasnella sp. JGI-2019a]